MTSRLHLDTGESVVLVPRSPLGDGLVSLVLAWNLHRAGAAVHLVHDQLLALRDWLPGITVTSREQAPKSASVVVHHAADTRALIQATRAEFVLREYAELHRHAPRPEVLRDLVQQIFVLEEAGAGYALVPPELPGPFHERRILIHPESGEPARSWPAARFFQLAERVRERDLEPWFVVAPHELHAWEGSCRERGFDLLCEADLGRVAREFHASRALVGNDSGLGHLAAAVGLPVTILFTRRRVAERWGPRGEAPVEWVLPPVEVPVTSLQRILWKHTVRSGRVEAALDRLLAASDSR